jgi:hypothetical protein
MLAGRDLARYPLIEELPRFYKARFDAWLAARADGDAYVRYGADLRAKRKELVTVYVLKK